MLLSNRRLSSHNWDIQKCLSIHILATAGVCVCVGEGSFLEKILYPAEVAWTAPQPV